MGTAEDSVVVAGAETAEAAEYVVVVLGRLWLACFQSAMRPVLVVLGGEGAVRTGGDSVRVGGSGTAEEGAVARLWLWL